MQPPIPQQQAAERGLNRTSIEARISEALAVVVTGARRRALRDGDRQIDTAHLLHALLESDPEVRAAFDSGQQVARLLGYLVQRSIGYGLRWQGGVEDSGALRTVREDGWSPVAAGAMEKACALAERRGRELPDGIDLLAAVITDSQSRAVEVLGRAGVDVQALRVRLEAAVERGVEA
ncbi:Clp protease N-terminal domain-containing protein [Streptomyces sporangiiformans]|uniref:Peptidase n=1 Tax=Streptomyces sporangiiformans TaxID=2315329 RepID=A0A505D0N2_9ACTN|nr:Clp protease N-terminal domain-containing protein [Streptomyces sporangiiformans]TPQ15702.1 peptidase [Streptomyces sporangiiformans]